MAPSWNLTPNGPRVASDYIVSSSCVSCLKMLFGNPADDTNDSPLVLPQNWGNDHASCVASWIDSSKMTHQIRVELEMHQNLGQQEQEAIAHEEENSSEDENDEQDQENEILESGGRRSNRRR